MTGGPWGFLGLLLFAQDVNVLADQRMKQMIERLSKRYDIPIVELDRRWSQRAILIADQLENESCDEAEGVNIPALANA